MDPTPLLSTYFEALTEGDFEVAEDRIVAASAGAIAEGNVSAVRADAGGAGDDESRWLHGLWVGPNSVRSLELFGALGSVERGERIAHIAFERPVPHPRIDGALVRVVPVLPPRMRPPVLADGYFGPPPIDRLYGAIARAAALLSYGDDAIPMLASPLRALFDGWADRTWSAWSSPDHERGPVPDAPRGGPWSYVEEPMSDDPWSVGLHDPVAIDFAGDAIVLAFPHALVSIDGRSGAVRSVLPTHGTALLAVSADARALMLGLASSGHLVDVRSMAREATRQAWEFAGTPFDDAMLDAHADQFPSDAEGEDERTFVLDLRTGRWGGEIADMPRVWFSEGLERSFLHDDAGRSTELLEVGDYPVVTAFTPDHRFVWVEDKHGGGGVFRARDGACIHAFRGMRHDEVHREEGVPLLVRDGSLSTMTDVDAWYALLDDGGRASAIVRRDESFLTLDASVVAMNDAPLFLLDFAPKCAAFDSDGSQLALVDRDTLRIVSIGADGAPRLISEWPLARFVEALDPPSC